MQTNSEIDDAITHAMGLGAFELVGNPPVLRILFKPSFHPTVCLTLEQGKLKVVSLETSVCRQPAPTARPIASASADFSVETLMSFGNAMAKMVDGRIKQNWAVLDGMSVSAVWKDGNKTWRFHDHAHEPQEEMFFAKFLVAAHAAIADPMLRNRIAQCAAYVEATLPIEPEPVIAPQVNLLVLGTEDHKK